MIGIGHGDWSESKYSLTGLSNWFSGALSWIYYTSQDQYQPEYVFHLAGGSSVASAVAHPIADFKRTVDSTAHLLDWLRSSAPTRLIAISVLPFMGLVLMAQFPSQHQLTLSLHMGFTNS